MRCYFTLKTDQAPTDLQQEQRRRLALLSGISLVEQEGPTLTLHQKSQTRPQTQKIEGRMPVATLL